MGHHCEQISASWWSAENIPNEVVAWVNAADFLETGNQMFPLVMTAKIGEKKQLIDLTMRNPRKILLEDKVEAVRQIYRKSYKYNHAKQKLHCKRLIIELYVTMYPLLARGSTILSIDWSIDIDL